MKRIAIFHCGFIYTGGGERIVIEEVRGLRKRGFKVDCFVPIYEPSLSYPDIIRQLKVRTFLPALPAWVPLRLAWQMILSCVLMPFLTGRFKDYDVIIGANQPGAYLAWVTAKMIKKPYLVFLNQPNRVLYPRDHEDWQNVKDYYFLSRLINQWFKPVVEWLDSRSINGARELLINGRFVAREIKRIYRPKSWVDCPAGARPVAKRWIDNDRFKGRARVNGWQFEKPYILLTSRHVPWKKFDWAIQVMAKVIKKYHDVRLIIPGAETGLTPRLKKLAKDLNLAETVIFTGPITQQSLWRLYRQAAVYIFTSPKEDLGIVVEEAQAAGVPVVAWNRGGPTVTVIDSQTGYLIKPYDQAKMAARIVYLLKNPGVRSKFGRQAWSHIKQHFSWEKHLDILEKEINRL